MSQEQLKTFQCSGKTSPKGHHSIGLANVNQRLHSYYGEEYGLLVESIPGEGTIIDITIKEPDGETIQSNLKITASDMELFEQLRTISSDMQ